ncbi:MAG: YfiT family bacillithiol transferase [Bacteroidia bacterium]
MTETELEKLKYPIGRFEMTGSFNPVHYAEWSNVIIGFPEKLEEEVRGLEEEEYRYRYRPDGWTILQVIHHLADSHMNALIRFKLTLTEDKPVIKPYQEAKVAELSDSLFSPAESSLLIITGLHQRWGQLLGSMHAEDFQRTYFHPEYNKEFSLDVALAVYAWHCKHHLEHIRQAKTFGTKF